MESIFLVFLSLLTTGVSLLILEGTRHLYQLAFGLAAGENIQALARGLPILSHAWNIFPSIEGTTLILSAAVVFFLCCHKFLGGYCSACSSIVGHRIAQDVQARMAFHLFKVPAAYFKGQDTGTIVKKILTDSQGVQALLITVIIENISKLITLAGILAYLFYLDWRLALTSIVLVPIYLIVMFPLGQKIKASAEKCNQILGEVSGYLEEAFSGIEAIKIDHAGWSEHDRFNDVLARHYRAKCRWSIHQSVMNALIAGIQELCPLIALGVGVYLVFKNELAAGTLPVFIFATRMIFPPISSLSMGYANYQNLLTFLERIVEVLSLPLDSCEKDASPILRPIEKSAMQLEVKKVRYTYPDRKFMLSDVDFTVFPGDIVVICGETGSGKSTLFSLIHRLVEPEQGEIFLGGGPLGTIDRETLSRFVGYMPQKTFCFRRSLRENILYGLRPPFPPDEKIMEYARMIGLEDDILGLESGLDTRLARRGENLSGGQQKMVGLLRVALKGTPLVLLDEPLAGISPQLRKQLIERFSSIFEGKSVLAITHHMELAEIGRAHV